MSSEPNQWHLPGRACVAVACAAYAWYARSCSCIPRLWRKEVNTLAAICVASGSNATSTVVSVAIFRPRW